MVLVQVLLPEGESVGLLEGGRGDFCMMHYAQSRVGGDCGRRLRAEF
jgi:hypothetical protein